jgi:adenine-specific DNA-methyltransferase
MPLPDKIVKEIKSIIQKFINEKGSTKSEEDVQTYYTVKILELLGWKSDKTTINTTQTIGTGERPDILLRGSGGGTIFLVESKEPSKSLDGKYQNKTFVEQICRYCNSEGVNWGILTNFKEWRIYNSYTGQIYDDKGKFFKVLTVKDDKINDFKELFDFFEKITYENLNRCKGKIDISSIYYKKQDEIKDEFFVNLKQWRKDLRDYLYNIFKKKSDKNIPEIVERLTQKILDRMIFIEVCNDKNIISNDILGSILYSKRNKYEELKAKFKELDEKFNSDLFADDVDIDSVEIDDEPMEEIIRGINNIDFSGLSVHIIGEVYENYLGELLKKRKEEIKIDETKQRAKRKEQGIYYTPDYIVNYIVENTLGEILKNCKTHDEIQKIRVLDPACGSGSFLIRAFDEFYKAYDRVYSINPNSSTSNSSVPNTFVIPTPPVIPECSSPESTNKNKRTKYTQKSLFDDFEIKKKILLYNLYGVDLDERAVDIAKLNLLIKALEGISDTALEGKRKLLPNLNLNIRCGNSLVSGKSLKDTESEEVLFDYSAQFKKDIDSLIYLKERFRQAIEDFEKKELLESIFVHEEKINSYLNKGLNKYFKNIDEVKPFNYDVTFCEIFKDGGFDCVIGNPPYVQMQNVDSLYRNFYKNWYHTFFASQMDLWHLFINR